MVICKTRSMGGSKLCQWIVLLCVLGSLGAESYPVDITYVESAVKKGAVCLDGSPPAYHLSPGFGDGSDNWLIRLEGGAWCDNTRSCLRRREGRLGSSKKMVKTLQYSGMFGNQKRRNPDFYNWNKVKVRYCDGASFTGDIEAVDNKTKLYYRGARVFQAVMDDLLEKGMKHAKKALFSGCSAGGLAAILHCDNFRSLLPSSAKVKCLSDAGYFINIRDISGAAHIERFFKNVVNTHGSAKNLPSSCTSKRKAGLCFFPENMARHIKTPLFILNSAYDSWQTRNILVPRSADSDGTWKSCKSDITKCSSSQLTIMQGFRKSFLRALGHGGTQSSRGFFIDSCYVHCQIGTHSSWLGKYAPKLNNKPLGKVVGDWFYDRKSFQKIDCPYPCNKTCKNRVYGMAMFPEEIDI